MLDIYLSDTLPLNKSEKKSSWKQTEINHINFVIEFCPKVLFS